jgi:hypothetical protein
MNGCEEDILVGEREFAGNEVLVNLDFRCGADSGINLAGRQGFEPRYRGPEPRVLPLDDLPIRCSGTSRNPDYIQYEL